MIPTVENARSNPQMLVLACDLELLKVHLEKGFFAVTNFNASAAGWLLLLKFL